METQQESNNWLSRIRTSLLYLAGILFVINGIGLFLYSYGSGLLMTVAGFTLFPQTQQLIEERTKIELTPLLLVGIIGFLFLGSSAFLFNAVDVASEAPDVLVPFS